MKRKHTGKEGTELGIIVLDTKRPLKKFTEDHNTDTLPFPETSIMCLTLICENIES